MPKFSVVISVYNKEQYIAATLQSVLDQTFQDFEIVILNDGSTDASEKEILKFKDPRISYFSEKNQGAAAGRNYVINKAKGEYIALLDADDFWLVNYLEEQYKSIKKHPNQSVFATAEAIEKSGVLSKRSYSVELVENDTVCVNYFESSYLDSILHSSSTILKKDIYLIKLVIITPK